MRFVASAKIQRDSPSDRQSGAVRTFSLFPRLLDGPEMSSGAGSTGVSRSVREAQVTLIHLGEHEIVNVILIWRLLEIKSPSNNRGSYECLHASVLLDLNVCLQGAGMLHLRELRVLR